MHLYHHQLCFCFHLLTYSFLHYFCAAHARILHQFLIAMLITQPQRVLSLSLLSHTTILFHSSTNCITYYTLLCNGFEGCWVKKNREIIACQSGQGNDVKLQLK